MQESFATLGLDGSLLLATGRAGYDAPTAIQSAAIPPILRGQDVLAMAPTGTGKTAAFVLPMLQRLLQSPRAAPRAPRALLLVPTRELAAQVAGVVRAFARTMPEPLKLAVAVGGVSINPQMLALRGAVDILVATPGRLLELHETHALRLSAVQTLVLDEADRLLDLGFTDELQRILRELPVRRQNLLFSATFPDGVRQLADTLLHDPETIDVVAGADDNPAAIQRAIAVDTGRRTALLKHLLQDADWTRVLVFVATRYATEHVAEKLRRGQVRATALHGDLSQGARSEALESFRNAHIQVLVATDVAARGIDIAQLPVVVNYDLPRSADDYLHRIGRTARAGAGGVAVSFVTADQEGHFRLIEKRHRMNVPREIVAGFEPQVTVSTTEGNAGGIKGRRRSKKDKLREAAARRSAPPT
jgi:superfamily II DNA/RNA helicase